MQALYYLILDPLLRFFNTCSTSIFSSHSRRDLELVRFIPHFMPPLYGVRKLLKYLQLGQDPAHIPEPVSLRTLAQVHLPMTKFGL